MYRRIIGSKLLNNLFAHWKSRNDTLYKIEAINQLSGLELLKVAIRLDHNNSLIINPPEAYSGYFSGTVEDILLKSVNYIKR